MLTSFTVFASVDRHSWSRSLPSIRVLSATFRDEIHVFQMC